MSLFNLFKKNNKFIPIFKLSEYDNWLNFLSIGGTSKEWEKLKANNNWIFKESSVEKFERYQKEVKPFSKPYYDYLTLIEKNWSIMYRSKDYNGELAKTIETDCFNAIAFYKKMKEIDLKYGKKTPTNIPPFKRLAMLYERQERFEECVEVCKEAYFYGMDETGRLACAIKKIDREPTEEEKTLINNC